MPGMTLAQSLVAYIVSPLIGVVIFLIFAEVVITLLVQTNLMNLRNPTVAQIYRSMRMITEPILRPIRNVLPPIGRIDFSPVVALIGLQWFNAFVINQWLYNLVG